MLRPTAGELVRNIADGLRRSVLPALPPGAAQRQLKAALHALGRIEQSWDRLPPYLTSDNADIRESLDAVLRELEKSSIAVPRQFVSLRQDLAGSLNDHDTSIPGITDGALGQAAALNLELQSVLVELDAWLRSQTASAACVEQSRALEHLYSRMVDRELQAWATEVNAE